jgi:hypothetical protein
MGVTKLVRAVLKRREERLEREAKEKEEAAERTATEARAAEDIRAAEGRAADGEIKQAEEQERLRKEQEELDAKVRRRACSSLPTDRPLNARARARRPQSKKGKPKAAPASAASAPGAAAPAGDAALDIETFVPSSVDIQAFTNKPMGSVLAQLWAAAEGDYTTTARNEFRSLRELRAVFMGHTASLRAGFLRYLRRPDEQQALITAFQGAVLPCPGLACSAREVTG